MAHDSKKNNSRMLCVTKCFRLTIFFFTAASLFFIFKTGSAMAWWWGYAQEPPQFQIMTRLGTKLFLDFQTEDAVSAIADIVGRENVAFRAFNLYQRITAAADGEFTSAQNLSNILSYMALPAGKGTAAKTTYETKYPGYAYYEKTMTMADWHDPARDASMGATFDTAERENIKAALKAAKVIQEHRNSKFNPELSAAQDALRNAETARQALEALSKAMSLQNQAMTNVQRTYQVLLQLDANDIAIENEKQQIADAARNKNRETTTGITNSIDPSIQHMY